MTTRLSGFAPQISFNFGRDEGWSYFSGGLGSARMTSERDDVPVTGTPSRTQMLNYGGGARFFNTPHLAFTFDIRFYAISPRDADGHGAGLPAREVHGAQCGGGFQVVVGRLGAQARQLVQRQRCSNCWLPLDSLPS